MGRIALRAALIALLLSVTASAGVDEWTFPAGAVRTIDVRTEGGAITLDVSAGDAVSAAVAPEAEAAGACVVARSLRGGVLTLTARSKSLFGGAKPCRAGFAASAPATVGVDARAGSGSVELGAFSGPISVRTDSGMISLHGPSGPLTLRTASGDITGRIGGQDLDVRTASGDVFLQGLTGSVAARTLSGAVGLAWSGAPLVGRIDVRTVSGDFLARLPDDARFKFALKTRTGKARSDFRSDPAAPLSLTFRSSSGFATLRKSGPVKDKEVNFTNEVFDRGAILRW